MLVHGFQLCTVYSLEVEQTGQGCFKVSVSSFFFFCLCWVSTGRRSALYQEGVTDTHPPSVDPFSPSVRQRKSKKSASLVFGVNTVGSYGSCSSTWAATSPEWNCPLWKASANVYFPSRSAVEFNCGYKGEVGGKQRMWWWWVATV